MKMCNNIISIKLLIRQINIMNQKKFGLSLRGGGAHAGAYIGILQALEENQIHVDYIVGASGGAIIGGLYAAGLKVNEIHEIFKNNVAKKFIGLDSLREATLVSEEKSVKYLVDVIGDIDIPDTKIKLYIQATNLEEGDVEYLEKGHMATAMVASSAIPMMIKPVDINGHHYIDGDVTAGFGVEVLKAAGAEVILGAACRVGAKYNKEINGKLFDKIFQPFVLSHWKLLELDQLLNPVDIFIDDLGDINLGLLDGVKGVKLQQQGYDKMMDQMDKLQRLLFK